MSDWLPPTLTTQRLILRPFSEGDVDAVFAYASNPNVTRFTLWDTHRTREESRQYAVDYAQSRYQEHVPEPIAITLRAKPQLGPIGSIGCFWVSQANATMELGYCLGEPYWNQGIVTEAAQALLKHTFETYKVERLQARVMDGNDASVRVLEKLQFHFEGTLRSSLYHRGRFRDVMMFSLLRGEWESTRDPPSDNRNGDDPSTTPICLGPSLAKRTCPYRPPGPAQRRTDTRRIHLGTAG